MSRNPYSPPTAVVADEVVPRPPMPAAVRSALIVIVVSFVVHLVILASEPRTVDVGPDTDRQTVAHLLSLGVSLLVGVALNLWLGWKIAMGRNWARIVLLVLTAISVPFAFVEIVRIAPDWPLGAGLSVVEQGLDIAVIVLLFVPGRAWFRKHT